MRAMHAQSATPPAQASPRPWLTQYPVGVPADVTIEPTTTLVDILEGAFRQYARRDAAACMGTRWRFEDVDRLSHDLGAWLQHRRLVKGARVALMMPNLPQYMVAIAAVLRAGFVVVNVNPLYTPRELEHQLNDSGAEAILVLESFATTLEDVIDRTAVRHVVLVSIGDLLGFWKGRVVNFAVRHLRKAVPEFRLPTDAEHSVTRFGQACADGSRLSLRPAVHRRHDRSVQGGHAAASQCRCQHRAD
jgi:long-chain acyl-CoA synthetase